MHERVTNQSSDRGTEGTVALGSYLLVPFIWWREIILGTLSVAAGGGALLLALHVLLPRYETSVDVAIIPTRTNVAIDDRIRTGAPIRNRSRFHEAQARQAALVGLVHNGIVAGAVSERLTGQMEGDELEEAELLTKIRAALVTNDEFTATGSKNSDLIRITARADSPEKTANIANAWGEEFTRHVNMLYQQAPTSVIRGIAAQEERAQEAYEAAQQALEAYIANSRIAQLEHLIENKRAFILLLGDLWKKSAESEISTSLSEAESRRAVAQLQAETLQKALENSYQTREKLFLALDAVRAFRLTMENSGEAGGRSNWLTILLLKTALYAPELEAPGTLDIHIENFSEVQTDVHDQITDLDGILSGIEAQIQTLDEVIPQQIQNLRKFRVDDIRYVQDESQPLSDIHIPSDFPLIASVEKEVRELQAEHAKATARLGDLTRERDLQRAALESLQNESIELLLTTASATAQVRLASKAVIPRVSAYPSPQLIMFLGGGVGLMTAVCLAFLANSMGISPPFGRNSLAWLERIRGDR